MKIFSKIMVAMMIILTLCGVCFAFTGCDKDKDDEIEAVYEIKLYDDNWVELQQEMNRGVRLVVKYDGTPKMANAIVYKNNQEAYRFEYKNGDSYKEHKVLKLKCIAVNVAGESGIIEMTEFPSMPGEYLIKYCFYDGEEKTQENQFFIGQINPYVLKECYITLGLFIEE